MRLRSATGISVAAALADMSQDRKRNAMTIKPGNKERGIGCTWSRLVVCVPLLLASASMNAQQMAGRTAAPAAPYLDYRIPIELRVKDLVSRLTLEEKISL